MRQHEERQRRYSTAQFSKLKNAGMIVYLAAKGLSYMMTLTAYVMPEKQG